VRHDPGNRQADLPQRQQRSGSRWHQLTCKEAAQHGIKVSSSGINAAVVLLSAARSPIFLAFWCCCLRSIQTICSLSSPAFTARQALPASAPPRSPTQIDSESLGGSTHALASRAEAKPAAAEAKRSRRSSAPHCPARAAESRRSETQAKGSAETLCLFAGKALEPQTQGGLFRVCVCGVARAANSSSPWLAGGGSASSSSCASNQTGTGQLVVFGVVRGCANGEAAQGYCCCVSIIIITLDIRSSCCRALRRDGRLRLRQRRGAWRFRWVRSLLECYYYWSRLTCSSDLRARSDSPSWRKPSGTVRRRGPEPSAARCRRAAGAELSCSSARGCIGRCSSFG
jgi:hypothetical protein